MVTELDAQGSECRCRCRSCSLGLCVCAPHGTVTVVEAWRDTAPGPDAPGIAVRAPRQGSAAHAAGLASGDRVVAADGQTVANDSDVAVLQAAVRRHGPGEDIALTVRGKGGESREVRLTRPAA